jgi:hypothetical protein
MRRHVLSGCCRSLFITTCALVVLAGCSGSGSSGPDSRRDPDAHAQAEPPSSPTSPPPAPTSPPPAAPPSQSPAPQTPPATPVIGPLADATCDGRKALALANARADSLEQVAQRRAVLAIQCDAYEIMERVATAGASQTELDELQSRVRDLAMSAVEIVRANGIESSRLPLSAPHRQMFELAAEAERAQGATKLQAWATNPWKPLHPLERPSGTKQHELSTALMRGERRALALNVRSSASSAQSLRLSLELAAFPVDDLQFYRVNWTGNDRSDWAAAELEPLGDASVARETTVLPGVTQQIWIQVRPGRSHDAGRFVGSIVLSSDNGATTRIPLDVTVFATRLAERPAMHFAGWDFTGGPIDPRYAVTQANRRQLIAHLRQRHVDVPWALRRVMDWANVDSGGNLTQPLDATALAQWLSDWQGARRFRVHLSVRNNIAGIPETDARFAHAVSTWAQAWAAQIRRLDGSPEQFDLLLVDEPVTADAARTTELWARAIRESGAGFKIWTDPVWPDPYATPQNVIDAADTISINLGFAERAGNRYWEWARELAERGKSIELYACDGPARRMDPYTYYRLTAWRAFFVGATAVSFWSFADHNRTPVHNEFATADAEDYNYSPLFIGARVLPGKHMEAAAEGIEDTEYLRMLRAVAQTHALDTARLRADELLRDAEAFVWSSPSSSGSQWRLQTENSGADEHRREIGQFLDSLAP